jgi:hypothetical protein
MFLQSRLKCEGAMAEDELPEEERPVLSRVSAPPTIAEAVERAVGCLLAAEVGIGNTMQAGIYNDLASRWLTIAEILLALGGNLDATIRIIEDDEDDDE